MHRHGGQFLRRLVPNYAVVFRVGWVHLQVTLSHRRPYSAISVLKNLILYAGEKYLRFNFRKFLIVCVAEFLRVWIYKILNKKLLLYSIVLYIGLTFMSKQNFRMKHKCLYRRCPWCNGYCRRKWTRRYEFKSWTRLIAFNIALIAFGKVWIQLFSLQL